MTPNEHVVVSKKVLMWRMRRWRARNIEHRRAYEKAYYQAHKEKFRKDRAYRKANGGISRAAEKKAAWAAELAAMPRWTE